MAKIILTRTSQYANNLRNYDVYIDNKKIDIINDGEEKVIEVSPGNHTMFLKIDWCKSKMININLKEEEEIKLICGSRINGKNNFLAIFQLFSTDKFVYLDYYSESKVVSNNEFNEFGDMGIKEFVFKKGILSWGIQTSILVSLLNLIFDFPSYPSKRILISILVNFITIVLLGGTLFGFIMWKLLENKKKS